MGVGCWASYGSPSILFRLASSSRGPSQLVHPRNSGQTAPVFFIFWPISAQSDTEAQGKIACCPSDRPDNMVQQLAGVDQHHVRCRCAIDRDPKTLDEHCFISFSQTPKLVDERRRYMTQFVLEDICHLRATLLTDDQSRANKVSMSNMALPFTITTFFISCIVFTFLSILLWNAPGSKSANFSL